MAYTNDVKPILFKKVEVDGIESVSVERYVRITENDEVVRGVVDPVLKGCAMFSIIVARKITSISTPVLNGAVRS